jgi:hypothetical protein
MTGGSVACAGHGTQNEELETFQTEGLKALKNRRPRHSAADFQCWLAALLKPGFAGTRLAPSFLRIEISCPQSKTSAFFSSP